MKKITLLIAVPAFISAVGFAHADEHKVDKAEALKNSSVLQHGTIKTGADDLKIISCDENDSRPECQPLEKNR